jgi:DNA invertase Pin-like site-specific DNA recombinase
MADRLTPGQLDEMFRRVSGHATMPPGWTQVGAWIRVSSGGQDEENQVPAVIRHCIQQRYWPVVWYVVHAKSAFKGEHQDVLDQAVGDMRAGQTAVLVVWHSDRLERRHDGKTKTLMGTLAEFTDAGGRVESVQEPTLGQLDFGGQVTTFITGLINHEKSKHISEQVNLAFDRIEANDAVRGNVPWGYVLVGPKYDKKQVATDVARVYVPQIFIRCADGDSLRTIATWLDSEKVKPLRAEKWHERSVWVIIRNRAYAGRRMSKDGKTLGSCEAVIDMALWKRANDALKTRPKRGPSAENKPLLAKLTCPRCMVIATRQHPPMYRIRVGGNRERKNTLLYYRCAGSGPQRKSCGNMVRYERLENMVAVRVLAWHDEPHQIRNWEEGKNWDAELENTAQSIRELDPLADDYDTALEELRAELKEYKRLNDEESTAGHWAVVDVLNDDGTLMTKGEYFYDLYQPYLDGGNVDPAREYLKTFDIQAEKLPCCSGIRVLINNREDTAHEEDCSGDG